MGLAGHRLPCCERSNWRLACRESTPATVREGREGNPTDGQLVSIAEPEPSYWSSNRHQTLRYSWRVSLLSPRVASRRTRRGGAALVPKGAARSALLDS